MKLRHAAVLALVGWYLIAPPAKNDNDLRYNAPLSQWTIEHVFDSAVECDVVRTRWRWHAKKIMDAVLDPKQTLSPADGRLSIARVRQLEACECIASDDPRLKGGK
jgi:hypothetical protein